MKKTAYISICLMGAALISSCADLDLNPLSSASSENWYSDPAEMRISLNDFYRSTFFQLEEGFWTDRRTDDWNQRTNIYDIPAGTINSSTAIYKTLWSYTYKNISRANRLCNAADRLEGKFSDSELAVLRAESRFFRAYAYSRLITLWGDVPFYTEDITPEDAFKMGRTAKATVLEQVYNDFDYAADHLPLDNNGNGMYRVNKGTALGIKARTALYMKDYDVARDAAKACMELGKYSLHPDYGELFRSEKMGTEIIFALPHSNDLEINEKGEMTTQSIKSFMPRTAGGTATAQPSWELLAAYECTDGKTIDQSPLFDPHNPFANRDPRCCETFAAPGSEIFGVIFDPTPGVSKVFDSTVGKEVTNKDTKTNTSEAPNVAYNDCCLRKGAKMEWRETLYNDNFTIIIRYADVLLMYAEAMIELNTIDQSVLNAINDVRARAYGVDRKNTSSYPAVTTTDQTELRRVLRRERRVEFAWEGRRFFDLLRWHWFEKAFANHMYGHVAGAKIKDYQAAGNWFWPGVPAMDEDGFVNFAAWADAGLVTRYGERVYDSKIYLWPIPADEIITMGDSFIQNPGY